MFSGIFDAFGPTWSGANLNKYFLEFFRCSDALSGLNCRINNAYFDFRE